MTLPFPSPRRAVSSLLVLGALVALPGCGGGETKVMTLAEMSDRSLVFALADVDDAEMPDAQGAHRFTVSYSLKDGGPCSQFAPDVTATLNGAPMTLVPGRASDVSGRGDACENSRAYFNFDPAAWGREPVEDLVVQLQDSSGTVRLVVQNGKAKRKFTFQGGGAPDKLRVGQSYDFLWEPGTEQPGPVDAILFREGGRAPGVLATTLTGNVVTVAIPAGTPQANHTMTLSADLVGTVKECTGVAACSGAIFHAQDFVLAVVP
jgi:hypothetical protein